MIMDAPTVLVIANDQSLVDLLVRNLKAHGLAVFGTTSLDEAVRSMPLLAPEVVIVDPTSEECFALLDNFHSGWKSIGLVAIVESEAAAQRAREMGINEVIMSRDIGAVVDAVLDLLVEKPESPAQGEGVR